MSVLVVEDDRILRETLALALRDEGYVVYEAADGKQALAQLATPPPPALILLDLVLPEMDGFELRAHLQADERLARIPVIIVSAHPNLDGEARRLGAVDHLSKPIDLDELLFAVQNRAVTVSRSEHFLCGAHRIRRPSQ